MMTLGMVMTQAVAPVAASTAAAGDEASLFWGFMLLGAAVIVLALELVLPSGGLLALVAGIALVGSLVSFFSHSTGAGFLALALILVMGPLSAWYAFRIWSGSALAKRMILQNEGPDAIASTSLKGATGVAETPLRPVGTVRVNGQRRDALSELGIIEAGTHIIVVEDHDNQLKVRPSEADKREDA
jgi:membrane-bound serine protease (ClpP class)